MRFSKLEQELRNLEKPYAISVGKLTTAINNGFDCEKVLEQLKKHDNDYIAESSLESKYDYLNKKYRSPRSELDYKKRLSAVAQLFATDDAHKLFIEKEKTDGLYTDLLIGDKIYNCPYIEPVIPNDTIIYYSRTHNYSYAPVTSLQLYNDIIRCAQESIAQKFLGTMLTDKNLDTNTLFGNVYEHLKSSHVSTEYEKVARVISEQKPGTSIISIDIPTPEEYMEATGKPFAEDEYYEYLDKILNEAEGSISTEKLNIYIKEAILENLDKILFWFKTDDHEVFEKNGEGDANEISIKYDISKSSHYEGTEKNPEYIGTGYDLLLREKATTVLKIPIRKDKFAPFGLHAKTLYPDILDKNSIFTGNSFDLDEAYEIGYQEAINNSFNKREREKGNKYIKEVEEKLEKKLTPAQKDKIRECDEVKLTQEEKDRIIRRVDETYTGLEFMKGPMYKAFAHIKEKFTDRKVVTFFGNFRGKHRIEITPETFHNRITHDFHRCVIIYDYDKDTLKTSFFQTERAAGFDGSQKIKFENLLDDEKKLFNDCIHFVQDEINKYRLEKSGKTTEEYLVDNILNESMPKDEVPNTDSVVIENEKGLR